MNLTDTEHADMIYALDQTAKNDPEHLKKSHLERCDRLDTLRKKLSA